MKFTIDLQASGAETLRTAIVQCQNGDVIEILCEPGPQTVNAPELLKAAVEGTIRALGKDVVVSVAAPETKP